MSAAHGSADALPVPPHVLVRATSRERRLAEIGVLATVAIWSANFVVVKAAIGVLGPLDVHVPAVRRRGGHAARDPALADRVPALARRVRAPAVPHGCPGVRRVPGALDARADPDHGGRLRAAHRRVARVRRAARGCGRDGPAVRAEPGRGAHRVRRRRGGHRGRPRAVAWRLAAGRCADARRRPRVGGLHGRRARGSCAPSTRSRRRRGRWSRARSCSRRSGSGSWPTSPPESVPPEAIVAILYSGALAAGIANVFVFSAIRLIGPTRVTATPVPRAGRCGGPGRDLPRRADRAGPGRRRRDHRARRVADPAPVRGAAARSGPGYPRADDLPAARPAPRALGAALARAAAASRRSRRSPSSSTTTAPSR